MYPILINAVVQNKICVGQFIIYVTIPKTANLNSNLIQLTLISLEVNFNIADAQPQEAYVPEPVEAANAPAVGALGAVMVSVTAVGFLAMDIPAFISIVQIFKAKFMACQQAKAQVL